LNNADSNYVKDKEIRYRSSKRNLDLLLMLKDKDPQMLKSVED
jgi:hypothetical protein